MESRRLVPYCIHSWDSSCDTTCTKRSIDRTRLYVHAITVTMQLDSEWRNAFMRLIGKSDDRGKFYRPGGTWSSLLIPSDDVALLLRWRRIDKGRRDGTTREETMESALFLSSPFTNLANTPFTHTHDCLVNPPMSVYSSVPSSTWPPFPSFFFSLSLLFIPFPSPFLHFPSLFLFLPFEYQFHLSRGHADAILGLVNSGSTQISVRGLFTRRLIIFQRTIKASILRFLLLSSYLSTSLPLSLSLSLVEA